MSVNAPVREGDLDSAVGVGAFAAAALGGINFAAHQPDWPSRILYASLGLYAGAVALRLAARRREPERTSGTLLTWAAVLCAALPLTVRPGGQVLWPAGAWIAAAGALLGAFATLSLRDSFGIAPAVRGIVARGPYRWIRHPMSVSMFLVGGGYLAVSLSPWNVGVLATSMTLSVVLAIVEERLLLGRDRSYEGYAARVRWRFLPGVI